MTSNMIQSQRFNLRDWGLLVLRIGFGLMMLIRHGSAKLSMFPTLQNTFPDPLGVGSQFSLLLAVSAEFGAALLLVVGLFTRPAAFMLMFTMGVAVFGLHWDALLKVQELGIVYGTAYLAILISGAGRISLDELLARQYNRLPKIIKNILSA